MQDDDFYYAADPAGADVFAVPSPGPGVRIGFDLGLLTAYGSGDALPRPHRVRGRQGLTVFEDPLERLMNFEFESISCARLAIIIPFDGIFEFKPRFGIEDYLPRHARLCCSEERPPTLLY